MQAQAIGAVRGDPSGMPVTTSFDWCDRPARGAVPRPMRLLALAIAVLGCSTTRVVAQPFTAAEAASITEEVGGRSASIRIRGDSIEREVEDVVVSPSRVEWTDSAAPHARTQVPPAAVERIQIRRHFQGGAEGVLLGIAAGAAVGLVRMQYGDDRAYGLVLGAGAGVLGAVILGLGGLVVGHRSNVELTAPPPP